MHIRTYMHIYYSMTLCENCREAIKYFYHLGCTYVRMKFIAVIQVRTYVRTYILYVHINRLVTRHWRRNNNILTMSCTGYSAAICVSRC